MCVCVSFLRVPLLVCCPPDRKGLLDFMWESASSSGKILDEIHWRAALAGYGWGRGVEASQSQCSARAARQWIPPSIPPERLASGSHRVSRQSGSPVAPAKYPARAARQWFRQSSSPVDPAEYLTRAARQWIPPTAEYAGVACQPDEPERWIPPVSRQSSSPVRFCLMSRPAHSWVLHVMLVPLRFECALKFGKGDAFVLL